MTDDHHNHLTNDQRTQIKDLVERAIKLATPQDQMVERRFRPESSYTWQEPAPLAGLRAAQLVIATAERQAHEFARGLRSEGTSWEQVAGLLNIPWSEDYARRERAFELVAGPISDVYRDRYVSWDCAGPLGCGERIYDTGPSNGYPSDCERGHAEGCRRAQAERVAFDQEMEQREERARIASIAKKSVTDSFGQATLGRAEYVLSHGGRWLGWSTSESLAVALVLHDQAALDRERYSTRKAAIERIMPGIGRQPADVGLWLACIRAAATGEIEPEYDKDLRTKLGLIDSLGQPTGKTD